MSITFEEFQKIEMLDLKKQIQLVHSYISSGLKIDDITIRYAVDQERVLIVLHSYGFTAGPAYGDETDSKRMYKGLSLPYVEAYITAQYPGFVSASGIESTSSQTIEKQVTIEDFLDENFPNWRSGLTHSKSSLFGISAEELRGSGYYESFSRKSNKGKDKTKPREGYFQLLKKVMKK